MLENLLLQLLQRGKALSVGKYLENNLIIIAETIVFYQQFLMEVDLARESLLWWDDRWQQSGQQWWCPPTVRNGRLNFCMPF